MEDADAAAEADTQNQVVAKPCVDCGGIDCFNPPPGSTPDEIKEFTRQLEEQRDAINDIPPHQLIKNMDNYEKIGRGTRDALDRVHARETLIRNRATGILKQNGEMTREVARIGAAKDIKTIDVIHTPIFLREVRDEFHQKMVVWVRGQQIAR